MDHILNHFFSKKTVFVTGAAHGFGRTIILVLCLAAIVWPTSAQDILDLPLIISTYSDPMLYTYARGEVEPVTYCQPGEDSRITARPIALAPDGARFAFLGLPALNPPDYNGPYLGFTDIWLCDVAAQTVTQIAGQPEGARVFSANLGESIFTIHSVPSWSPDGTRLAWNEITSPTNTLQLIIYDVTTGAKRIVYERAAQSTMPARTFMPEGIEWGAGGIAIYDLVDSRIGVQSVTFVNPDTKRVHTVQLDGNLPAGMMRWALDGRRSVFVLNRIDGALVVLTPGADDLSEIPVSSLEFYSLFAPETSLRLVGYELDYQVWDWYVAGDTANSSFQYPLGIQGTIGNLALSPDGQQVAFVTFENYPFGGKLYVTSNVAPDRTADEIQRIEALDAFYGESGPRYIAWSPLGIRVVRS